MDWAGSATAVGVRKSLYARLSERPMPQLSTAADLNLPIALQNVKFCTHIR